MTLSKKEVKGTQGRMGTARGKQPVKGGTLRGKGKPPVAKVTLSVY